VSTPQAAPVQKAQRIVPVPTLAVTNGMANGYRIPLDKEVGTLGRRDDNDYVLKDPRVSRVHAEIRKEGSVIIVTDLGSSSGTEVNGETIQGPTVVRHGESISFGPVAVILEDPAGAMESDDTTLIIETPPVDNGPHLSPRQREVLQGMAEGLTNSQIGEKLGVTERTVKAYAQELYDRLGVHNRAGAVARGIEHRLL
jgi:pSer/pThr/pTyr-binding forkhead associated (FHA) protein